MREELRKPKSGKPKILKETTKLPLIKKFEEVIQKDDTNYKDEDQMSEGFLPKKKITKKVSKLPQLV